MKALSIRQPWVWAILNAGKTIENRVWSTNYRGPVLIHASKGMARTEYEHCLQTMHWISSRHPFPEGLTLPSFHELERGGIIGKARIVDCVSQHPSPWFFGPYGFVLADVEPVTFQPYKGALGFFNIEAA
jgi:hypothetical protein